METIAPPPPPPARGVRELGLLLDISQALNNRLDLREALAPVLRRLAEHMQMLRSTVTILNRESGEILVEEAHGLSNEERARGRYSLGEGVTGRVVQTGQPLVIPRVSSDPRFLGRTRSSHGPAAPERSFVCVPVFLGSEVIGTLSAERHCDDTVPAEEDLRLLSIISPMIAQAVRLRQSSREAVEALEQENARLHDALSQRFRADTVIGNSHAIHRLLSMIPRVAPSCTTVLIRGESGTGKELIAQCIHYNSPRAGKPFIKVNCAALPESVIESELFGHERGAFTGAIAQRKGRFELAEGGTIFLDEIGDISPATQVRLLRVLQEREFERVGSEAIVQADVRVIAATNRNLEEMLQQGTFREDLYYRLNVFPLFAPPLRERRTDIPLLADHFAEHFAKLAGKTVTGISPSTIDRLMAYHWPGNVRELQNCLERAVLLCTDGVIQTRHLPPSVQAVEVANISSRAPVSAGQGLKATLEGVEREMIIDTLKRTHGNMAEAARQLELTERIMSLRVHHYAIDPKRFKNKAEA